MTGEQAAEFLGVERKFMTRYREHKIPHRHVGRHLRFPPEELEDWVAVGEDAYSFICSTCPKLEAERTRRRAERERRKREEEAEQSAAADAESDTPDDDGPMAA